MANVDNSCAHLEVEDVFTESQNTLADLYNLQKDIQENVYGYNFEELREKPLNEFRQFLIGTTTPFKTNYGKHLMHWVALKTESETVFGNHGKNPITKKLL